MALAAGADDRSSHAWALPAAALAFGVGLVAGEATRPPARVVALGLAVFAGLAWRLRHRDRAILALLLVAFAGVGIARGRALPSDDEVERPIAAWLDHDVAVVGRLVTLPDGAPDESRFTLDTEALRDDRGWHPVVVRLRVLAPTPPALLRGTRRVVLRGALRPIRDAGNPGESPHAHTLHRAGFAGTLRARDPAWVVPLADEPTPASFADRVWRWRVHTAELLESSVPAQHAAVLEALLIGLTGGVAPDLDEIFVRTGTAHVLAVSGLNVALVVVASYWPVRRALGWSRWLGEEGRGEAVAAVAGFGAALAYVFLAGAEPPVIRSVVASGCSLAAAWLGRPGAALASLALGFVAITAVAPESLWSVSFQLSFLATAGLVVADERFAWIRRLGGGRDLVARLARAAVQTTVATAVATWVTLPLTESTFGRWTALGIVANPLAVPLLATAAVPIGLLGVALAPLSAPLASWVFRLAELPVAAGLGVLRGIATWPGLDGTAPRAPASLAWLGVALAVTALAVRWRWTVRLAALGTLAVALVAGFGPRLGARWRARSAVTFLAVGHGDAAVVALPGGRTWLVDAGPWFEARRGAAPSAVVPALEALGASRVDVLIASHLQLDHVGGLGAVLDRFPVGEVWMPAGVLIPGWLARELARAARRGTAVVSLDSGRAPFRHQGVWVDVVHPPHQRHVLSTNDASLVIRLGLETGAVLFAGDVERAGEALVAASGRDACADVLKVPHHGSATSSSFALLRAVRPRLAVVSAPRWSATHPAEEVVERLEALGAQVLDTGHDGALTVRLSPAALEVVRGKGAPLVVARSAGCERAPPSVDEGSAVPLGSAADAP